MNVQIRIHTRIRKRINPRKKIWVIRGSIMVQFEFLILDAGGQDPNIDKSWKKVERSGHACRKDRPRGYIFLPRNDLCFNRNCSSSTAPLSPPTVFPVRVWTDLSSSCEKKKERQKEEEEKKKVPI